MYRIEAVTAVKKDIRKLSPAVVKLLEAEHFPSLKRNPRCGEPLRQEFKGIWSYHFAHQGAQYRIIYEIDEAREVLYLLLIGARENLYDRLRRRIR
ncbi:MAG: type II toxin-antitoxin system mRNA interferase toxin, RelE/StbE family [Chloroflexi bacterium]|nr:type II toxin-antitoxin system mRNA interferase toxin, RelE/StbE family [Chloroflexota bacterium]